MVAITIGFTIGLFVLSIIMMLVASVKSVAQGKQDLRKVAIMAIPFIIFGVTYAVFSDVTKAGVFTMAFMMGAMILTIAYTGLRGTFK